MEKVNANANAKEQNVVRNSEAAASRIDEHDGTYVKWEEGAHAFAAIPTPPTGNCSCTTSMIGKFV